MKGVAEVLIALALLACGGDDDASVPPVDARRDAGSAGMDAGAHDAGRDPDGGVVDAGADTGTSAGDAGPERVSLEHVWSRPWGGIGDDIIEAITLDASDRIHVAGWLEDPIDFGGGTVITGAGGHEALIASFESNGDFRWAASGGGIGNDYAYAIASAPDGTVFVAGRFTGRASFGRTNVRSTADSIDAFVASYSNTGALRWLHTFGGDREDVAAAITLDAAGNVVVAGWIAGTADLGGLPVSTASGSTDIFIASYAPDGTHLWSQAIGGPGGDQARGVAIDSSGLIYLTGSFEFPTDLGTGPILPAGATDAFVLALDGARSTRWLRTLGDAYPDDAFGIAAAPEGVWVVGKFSLTVTFGAETRTSAGSTDVFATLLSTAGDFQRTITFGGAVEDRVWDVLPGPGGGVLVAGAFGETVDFGGGARTSRGNGDAYVVWYDAAGGYLWDFVYGNGHSDSVHGIAFDSVGRLDVGGGFKQTVDFGGGPYTPIGGTTSEIIVFQLQR